MPLERTSNGWRESHNIFYERKLRFPTGFRRFGVENAGPQTDICSSRVRDQPSITNVRKIRPRSKRSAMSVTNPILTDGQKTFLS